MRNFVKKNNPRSLLNIDGSSKRDFNTIEEAAIWAMAHPAEITDGTVSKWNDKNPNTGLPLFNIVTGEFDTSGVGTGMTINGNLPMFIRKWIFENLRIQGNKVSLSETEKCFRLFKQNIWEDLIRREKEKYKSPYLFISNILDGIMDYSSEFYVQPSSANIAYQRGMKEMKNKIKAFIEILRKNQ